MKNKETNEASRDEAQETYKKLNDEFEELGCFTKEEKENGRN